MIVSSDGQVKTVAECSATMSATVSMTGEAYGKKSTVRTIIRFFRKLKVKVLGIKLRLVSFCIVYFGITKTGKPSSMDPPSIFLS